MEYLDLRTYSIVTTMLLIVISSIIAYTFRSRIKSFILTLRYSINVMINGTAYTHHVDETLSKISRGENLSNKEQKRLSAMLESATGEPLPNSGINFAKDAKNYLKLNSLLIRRDEHDDVAFKVYKRLRLRHEQLLKVEKEANEYLAHGELSRYYERSQEHADPESLLKCSLRKLGIDKKEDDEALWLEVLIKTSTYRLDFSSDLLIKLNSIPLEKEYLQDVNSELLEKVYNKDINNVIKDGVKLYDNYKVDGYLTQPDLWLQIILVNHPLSDRLPKEYISNLYLRLSTSQTKCHSELNVRVCDAIFKKDSCKGISTPPKVRAYRLAVTDLFVEKALGYLETHAKSYTYWGLFAYVAALAVVALGTFLSFDQLLGLNTFNQAVDIDKLKEVLAAAPRSPVANTDFYLKLLESRLTFDQKAMMSGLAKYWEYGLFNFTRAFTAYGLLVLVAVGLWRFGKAMLDQSERLLERRHALRQGRLFLHLHDGQLSIDELDKAFNWNVAQANAFGNIPTDAQAPWGALAKETVRATPEIIKAATNLRKSKEEREE